MQFRESMSKLPELLHVDMVGPAFNPVGLGPESRLLLTTLARPSSGHYSIPTPFLCLETGQKVVQQFLERAHMWIININS